MGKAKKTVKKAPVQPVKETKKKGKASAPKKKGKK